MAKQNKKTTASFGSAEAFTGAPTEAMKDAFERATAMSGDFGALARSNMEAMTESLKVAGKGMTEINAKAFEFMQSNFQRNMEMAKTLGNGASADDMTAFQEIGKLGFQTYVEQMNELSGLFTTTLRNAAEPLNAQAGAVVEKFQANA